MSTIDSIEFFRGEIRATVREELLSAMAQLRGDLAAANISIPVSELPRGPKLVHPKADPTSGKKRAERRMCDPCIRGTHGGCRSELCPCACNDEGFSFARKKA